MQARVPARVATGATRHRERDRDASCRLHARRELPDRTTPARSLPARQGGAPMGTITTNDGTQIFYKDWGTGHPVVFSHGWPLNADAWDDQAMLVADNGHRAIAHDRRGHGRSSQPWTGHDLDTYADD